MVDAVLVRPRFLLFLMLRALALFAVIIIVLGVESGVFKAWLLIAITGLFLFRSRNNAAVFLVAFFIAYCNYSIAVGEYIVGGDLAAPFQQVRSLGVYPKLLDVLLVFTSIVVFFYNGSSFDVKRFRAIASQSNLLFYIVVFTVLVCIFVFGVNRAPGVGYSVRITPLYEYSYIFFIFCFMFSGAAAVGGGSLRERALIVFVVMFVLQDIYYGGRVTSMQLVYFLFLTCFALRLSVGGILVYGLVGIVVNKLVGVLRAGEISFSVDSFVNILQRFWGSYFVFDTPVFAYYASATHVAASMWYGFDFKMLSFWHFCVGVIAGSPDGIGNVTSYVRNNLYINQGGGLLPSHFYFWFGWSGVVFIAVLLVALLNGFPRARSRFGLMLLVVLVLTVPRWYLYSPLSLFRPLFLCVCLYMLAWAGKRLLSVRGVSA